jgi:MFS superfamily sulfate permease-like transporter
MVEETKTRLRALLIDAGAQDQLDLTSAEVLKGLVKELHGKDIAVYVADVHAPVLEFSQRTELIELIGEDRIFPTVDAAVRYLEMATE